MQTLEDKISIVNRYIRNGIKTGDIPLPEALTLDTAWRGIQRELKQLEQELDCSEANFKAALLDNQ